VSSTGYDFSGLLIGSPLKLHGLRAAADASRQNPDVQIKVTVGPLPVRRKISHAWKGRFDLTLEGNRATGWTIRRRDELAIVCDPSGELLDCICVDAAYAELLSEILPRRVLPRLSWLHGRLPIHGASLAQDDGAVLILGGSGAGKSTLTAAMAAAGWDILSDDMSIVSGPEHPVIWQTSPGVSVWEPSRRGLRLPETACRPIEGYDGKCWYAPPQRQRAEPAALAALLFLLPNPVDAIEWHRATGAAAAALTASQMIRFDPADNDDTAKVVDRLMKLTARIPCYMLSYPRVYRSLPNVIDAIHAIYNDARNRSSL
jgi:energy-coupling factor transporter ATP-binding protein EcfA2